MSLVTGTTKYSTFFKLPKFALPTTLPTTLPKFTWPTTLPKFTWFNQSKTEKSLQGQLGGSKKKRTHRRSKTRRRGVKKTNKRTGTAKRLRRGR